MIPGHVVDWNFMVIGDNLFRYENSTLSLYANSGCLLRGKPPRNLSQPPLLKNGNWKCCVCTLPDDDRGLAFVMEGK